VLLHDLLHCCNVRHHAPVTAEEKSGVQWTLGMGEGKEPILMEGRNRIRVVRESDGVDVTSNYLAPLQGPMAAPFLLVQVGSWQGSCSGHPFCVMASPSAQYFRSRQDPSVRYYVRSEELRSGHWLICSKSDSLQWNAPDHAPESHFGPAPAGGGDCLHQIVVNDAARWNRQ
jgi:hypothetical protein